MNKKLSTIIQIIVFMGLGLGLIYWRITEMSAKDKSEMMAAFEDINWWVLLPIAVIGFLSHLFRALRWKILLKTVDINASIANVTFSVLIGYLVNTLAPRFGEVAKCTVLAKYEKASPDKAVGTIIGERAFDMLSLGIVMLLFLFLERDKAYFLFDKYLGKYFHSASGLIWTNIIIVLGIMVLGLVAFLILYKKIKHTKIGNIIKSLGNGIASIWKLKERTAFLIYTILIWLMYTLMVYVGYFSLSGTAELSFASALGIIAFGSIGMIVTPGGIGVYPIIVSEVLLLFGISMGLGTAFGWICWGVQTVLVLILGLTSLILLPIFNGKRNPQQTRNSTI